MKRLILFLIAVMVMLNAVAQSSRLAGKDGFRLNWAERLGAKTGYQYRMSEFTTTDRYEFCYYAYDGAGRLVEVHDSVPGDFSLIDSMFYDGQGNMTRLSGWQWLDNSWRNVYYIDYTYDDAGNIASRTNYNNFGGSWELGGVYDYTYNADNQILLTILTMGGMQFQKVEYTYAQGRLMEELWYSYSFETSGLMPSEKINYVYDGDRLAVKHDSITDNGRTYSYLSRYEYSYDEYGNCEEYVYYDQTGQVAERSQYTFDYDMPLSEVQIPWNPEIRRPMTFNNVHAYEREAWYSVDVEHVLHYVCDYVYTYESATNGVGELEEVRLSASPNPATDYVRVEGLSAGAAQVHVFDALGRLVLEGNLPQGNNWLDVSHLAPGCYVVKIYQQGKGGAFKLMVE